MTGLSAHRNPSAESLLRFTDTRDTLLTASRTLTNCAAFLEVEGAASHGITIDGGDISKAATPVKFSSAAGEQSVWIVTR